VTEWAVKVRWDDDDWLWVTELAEGMDYTTPVVKTFSTQEEAERSASLWRIPGKDENVKVLEYDANSK